MRTLTSLVAACGLLAASSFTIGAPPATPPGQSDTHPGNAAGDRLPQNYIAAPLLGDNEVPEVESEGTGVCIIRMRNNVLTYKLIVDGLDGVTQAHLHVGPAGENGPIVAFLFGLEPGGVTAEGILAEGVLDDDGIIERPAIEFDGTRESLIREMQAGNVYVNVHTLAFPAGEIRGQVRSLGPQGKGIHGDDEEEENAPGSASPLLGDLNADGVVDEVDLRILLDNFTTNPTPDEPATPTAPTRTRRVLR